MRVIRAVSVPLAALALAGCTQIRVTVDHDPSANFTSLRTYAWRPGPQRGVGDPRFDNPPIDKRVRAAIERVLSSKGYRTATAGTGPDFFVGYDAVVLQKVSAQAVNRSYGYRVGTGGLRGGPSFPVRDYNEGTLLIDVVDPATMQLLWRGSGTGAVDPQASAEKREQRINDAVERILADFPPKE